jgi:ubiquinone/menaquinone biosynthesis C-methylase UbiE
MKRTHDNFYAKEAKRGAVKDIFRMIGDNIESLADHASLKIGDIGCATGDLPFYLASRFPESSVTGYEFLDSLLNTAREVYPELNFMKADITQRGSLPDASHDVLSVAGVISIFDDVEPVFDNLLHWVKPGGRVLVMGMFNPHDLDVYVKYKLSSDGCEEGLESGWNIVSQASVGMMLRKRGVMDYRFHPFEIGTDLEPRADDPVRSWTEIDATGRRHIFNGLNIRQPFHLLEINRPE